MRKCNGGEVRRRRTQTRRGWWPRQAHSGRIGRASGESVRYGSIDKPQDTRRTHSPFTKIDREAQAVYCADCIIVISTSRSNRITSLPLLVLLLLLAIYPLPYQIHCSTLLQNCFFAAGQHRTASSSLSVSYRTCLTHTPFFPKRLTLSP